MIAGRSQEVWLLVSRGRERIARQIEQGHRRTLELQASLRALSPAATLARGYAIAHLAGGVIVRDADQAPAGTSLLVTLDRGSLAARSEGEVPESGEDGARI
jgi:exodeoxyribonuclease VII large subunit